MLVVLLNSLLFEAFIELLLFELWFHLDYSDVISISNALILLNQINADLLTRIENILLIDAR